MNEKSIIRYVLKQEAKMNNKYITILEASKALISNEDFENWLKKLTCKLNARGGKDEQN